MFIILWELTPTMFIPPHTIFHATITVMVIKIKHHWNYYYSCDWGTNVNNTRFHRSITPTHLRSPLHLYEHV